jgi:hypothetical protein
MLFEYKKRDYGGGGDSSCPLGLSEEVFQRLENIAMSLGNEILSCNSN